MIQVEINKKIITPFEDIDFFDLGSELVFNGRVRNIENNQKILGLYYEHYEEMAIKELIKLSNETLDRFPIRHLFCKHRVGEVLSGEVSLFVLVSSSHRKESFEALQWFLTKLKKQLPIWKWMILKNGKRELVK
tara:strand:+ start:48225 stop:48626 length:402 start_codon:yes stop_codon:yes gene_type:complete